MSTFKIEDTPQAERWRVLIVGRSGSGKSTAALSFPGPRFLVDLDRRALTFRGMKDIVVYQPERGDGWSKINRGLNKELDKRPYPYQTTIFSSVTSAQRLFTQDSLNFITDTKGSQASGSESSAGAMKRGDLLIPGLQNYLYRSECLNQMFFEDVFLIENNIFVEAHIVDAYSKDGTRIGDELNAPNKFGEEAKGYFDEIWHFETSQPIVDRERIHKVYFHSKGFARTATDYLKKTPSAGIDITGKELYAVIQGLRDAK